MSRGARATPRTPWGRLLQRAAARVHHVVGVLAVAALALLVLYAVELLR